MALTRQQQLRRQRRADRAAAARTAGVSVQDYNRRLRGRRRRQERQSAPMGGPPPPDLWPEFTAPKQELALMPARGGGFTGYTGPTPPDFTRKRQWYPPTTPSPPIPGPTGGSGTPLPGEGQAAAAARNRAMQYLGPATGAGQTLPYSLGMAGTARAPQWPPMQQQSVQGSPALWQLVNSMYGRRLG